MQRFAANGYEIIVGENESIFVDRKTWGLGVLMALLGAMAVVLVVLRVLGASKIQSDLLNIATPAAAALFLVVIWIISRTYRSRRDQPIEEIHNLLSVDPSSQELRNRTGEVVAQIEDVKARMHIDWWTRGTMRIVVLSWPGGRRVIYRTFGRRRSLDLLAFLKEQGLDAQ